MSLPTALIDFAAPAADTPAGERLRKAFYGVRERLVAHTPAEVAGVIDAAHQAALSGRWCIGYLRYEAACAFDTAFELHAPDGPLAWFAVYERGEDWPAQLSGDYDCAPWTDLTPPAAFDAGFARIKQAIADGAVYQVNLTTRLVSHCGGSPLALFGALLRAQPGGYAAYLDAGDEQLLSVSPELFFDWRDGVVTTQPMKGTAPRGGSEGEDRAHAEHLRSSEKERAENLMIVDLIRNDLSRIARPFSVTVPRLFELHALSTVWQMTSTVQAHTRPGATLSNVFAALFPCGSVTGAPKIKAMSLIRDLEPWPRGVYCGAIGVLQPGGAATFNVGIRTVSLRGERAVCGVGSGITWDAQAATERREFVHKQRFLARARRPFELLETLKLEEGVYWLLERHLERMARAARHFGFAQDPQAVRDVLEAVARERAHGAWRVRLLAGADGRVQAQAFGLESVATPVRVRLATQPIDTGSEFVRFKTTQREAYERFTPEASVFDTLLWNERGQLTEFTRGNLAVKLGGVWITPALACGLLDGVYRAELLAEGRLQEGVLTRDDLRRAQAIAFINSVRGWLDAEWGEG